MVGNPLCQAKPGRLPIARCVRISCTPERWAGVEQELGCAEDASAGGAEQRL